MQTSWPDAAVLHNMADGTTERACYFDAVCTQRRKSQYERLTTKYTNHTKETLGSVVRAVLPIFYLGPVGPFSCVSCISWFPPFPEHRSQIRTIDHETHELHERNTRIGCLRCSAHFLLGTCRSPFVCFVYFVVHACLSGCCPPPGQYTTDETLQTPCERSPVPLPPGAERWPGNLG